MEIISGVYMYPSPLNRTCASTYIPNAISFHIFLGVRSSSVMKVANSLDTSSRRWRKRPFGISGEGGDEKRDKEWRWDERGWGLEMISIKPYFYYSIHLFKVQPFLLRQHLLCFDIFDFSLFFLFALLFFLHHPLKVQNLPHYAQLSQRSWELSWVFYFIRLTLTTGLVSRTA